MRATAITCLLRVTAAKRRGICRMVRKSYPTTFLQYCGPYDSGKNAPLHPHPPMPSWTVTLGSSKIPTTIISTRRQRQEQERRKRLTRRSGSVCASNARETARALQRRRPGAPFTRLTLRRPTERPVQMPSTVPRKDRRSSATVQCRKKKCAAQKEQVVKR